MATSHVSHGGITLPVLTNIADVGPNVKLQVLVKPKAKAAPIHEESAKKQKRSQASHSARVPHQGRVLYRVLS
eukprot:4321069-Pyramimonas_sp.AAC.1